MTKEDAVKMLNLALTNPDMTSIEAAVTGILTAKTPNSTLKIEIKKKTPELEKHLWIQISDEGKNLKPLESTQ
jgi:hypothetical protein